MSKKINKNRGVLLIEVMMAVAFFVAVATLGSRMIFVGQKSNQAVSGRDAAKGLLNEVLEAARAGSDEKWKNIYSLTKSTGHYYPQQSSGKWIFTAGDEVVSLNGTNYTRYFTVDNVSRDLSTRAIETSYNAAHDDPSTQKITANTTWTNGETLAVYEYLSRWRNVTCLGTSWNTAGSSGVKTCPDTTYDQASSTLTAGASLQLQ